MLYASPFGVCNEGGAAPALQRTHQIVVKGHAQLLAGLLLHHVDPAVLNVAWGHTQHIRLSLAGVSSQQNSTAHILPRMLLNQAVGPHRPRSSTFFIRLQLGHIHARVRLTELARDAPVDQRLQDRKKMVRGDRRACPFVAQTDDVLRSEVADQQLSPRLRYDFEVAQVVALRRSSSLVELRRHLVR